MTKFYSSKSAANKAAKKLDVAQVREIDGRWAVVIEATDDEVAPKQVDEPITEPLPCSMDRDQEAPTQEETPAQETDRLLMQLRVYVPAEKAVVLAARVAALVGNPVAVHAATSGNELQIVQAGAAKAAEARTPQVASSPSERAKVIIDLATRPEGVFRSELNKRFNTNSVVWKSVVAQVARTHGFTLQASKVDGAAVYHFLPA